MKIIFHSIDSNEEKILAFLSMFDELVDEMTNDELRKCLSYYY